MMRNLLQFKDDNFMNLTGVQDVWKMRVVMRYYVFKFVEMSPKMKVLGK